ncbi:hypothetical protein [Pseudooceanicola sp.]|uniref:hypothetical protein n=1 Tax=Pseudooceanicola sp. TaxID=1914328 RepID=UPI00260F66AA|nr:hypothetical protein [Pseudooceanicola sp.]MDF1855867.1 hypothetical protein [Pseudooceanicola sp.]
MTFHRSDATRASRGQATAAIAAPCIGLISAVLAGVSIGADPGRDGWPYLAAGAGIVALAGIAAICPPMRSWARDRK